MRGFKINYTLTYPENITLYGNTALDSLMCYSKDVIDIQCVTNHICAQVNRYILNYAIAIIILYIIMCWSTWWFFNHGYKRLKTNYFTYEKRIYWNQFIRDKFTKFCVGYIAVIVWFFI